MTKTCERASKYVYRSKCGLTVAALMALLPMACMSSSREEALNAQLRTLETKVAEMDKQMLAREQKVDSVKSTTEESQRRVQSTKNEVEDLRRELNLTQGAIDELRVKMTRMQDSSGKRVEDDSTMKVSELEVQLSGFDRRLSKVELASNILVEKTDKDAGVKGKVKAKYKSPDDLKKALNAAYVQKDFKKVVNISSSVLSGENPVEERELALQFRGEAYFALQDFERAAFDFTEFLDKFPKSEKRARALLLAGDSYVYLKQNKNAKSYYTECVKNFPDREECKASRERLDRLGG